MKLVIVGGGKVAYYLVRELSQQHEIFIVDEDVDAAEKIANQLSVSVIHGDGTSIAVLEPLCENADMLVALTGKDEDNLIACQVAKEHLNVPFTLARVNNPRNLEVMRAFGVDRLFSGTNVLAGMIEQEIDYQGLRIVHEVSNSDRVLIEFCLSENAEAGGKSLIEHDFINSSRVVVITTPEGNVITPIGTTVMNAGDLLMMVCGRDDVEKIWKEMVSI